MKIIKNIILCITINICLLGLVGCTQKQIDSNTKVEITQESKDNTKIAQETKDENDGWIVGKNIKCYITVIGGNGDAFHEKITFENNSDVNIKQIKFNLEYMDKSGNILEQKEYACDIDLKANYKSVIDMEFPKSDSENIYTTHPVILGYK